MLALMGSTGPVAPYAFGSATWLNLALLATGLACSSSLVALTFSNNTPCGQQCLFVTARPCLDIERVVTTCYFAGMSQNNTQVRLLLPLLFDGELHTNIEFLFTQVDSQEGVWTAHDFPAEVDKQYPTTQAQYQALKLHWLGTPVASRDPRVVTSC